MDSHVTPKRGGDRVENGHVGIHIKLEVSYTKKCASYRYVEFRKPLIFWNLFNPLLFVLESTILPSRLLLLC